MTPQCPCDVYSHMDPSDYEMVGVLGQLTSAIREKGTGEMSFSQAGSRRSAPARSEDGAAIEKGVDVIVTRYDKGIAYVRRWDELNDSGDGMNSSSERGGIGQV